MTTPSFNDYNVMQMANHRSGSLRDISLSKFTQLLGASVDNSTALTDIGFNFVFEGESYSRASVTSNGCVQLSGSGTTLLGVAPTMLAQEPQSITASFSDPVFAPWWGDLITAEVSHRGGVYKFNQPLGYGAHQETIFRFISYGSATNTAANAFLIAFEVVLNSLGGISFNYAPMITVGSPTGTDYVVGVGMKARNSVARYKYVFGSIFTSTTSIGTLLLPGDWPGKLNYERSFLMTPPKNLVSVSSLTANARTIR